MGIVAASNQTATTAFFNSQTLNRVGKREMAKRYQVGIRTIENWHARGIIHGGPQSGEILFEVADCDKRLLTFRR